MNYIGLNKYDTANGPGIRVSLFVSGCTLCCKGCFNKESWKFNAGLPFTDSIKNDIINELKKSWISGFSLLGGDPLEPKLHSEVLDLVKSIKSEIPNKDIWLWTGRIYENIINNDILKYIDVLIDGPFIQEFSDKTLKYKGSKNQRIINIIKGKLK
jgi:anaerobic ribonucleoside-triphosphate reductase activating protein